MLPRPRANARRTFVVRHLQPSAQRSKAATHTEQSNRIAMLDVEKMTCSCKICMSVLYCTNYCLAVFIFRLKDHDLPRAVNYEPDRCQAMSPCGGQTLSTLLAREASATELSPQRSSYPVGADGRNTRFSCTAVCRLLRTFCSHDILPCCWGVDQISTEIINTDRSGILE